MPKLPSGRRDDDGSKDAATLFAVLALSGVSLFLLTFSALVLPNLFGILLIGCMMVLFGVLQYFLWGRWLMNRLGRIDPEDDERPTPKAKL